MASTQPTTGPASNIINDQDTQNIPDGELEDEMTKRKRPIVVCDMLRRLPYELVELVVSHVDNIYDLRALARTSKLFQDLAEPHIYKSVLLREGTKAMSLAHSLSQRPARATWIRTLRNACQSDSFPGIMDVTNLVPQMDMLKHLLVETPDCNTFPAAARRPWLEQQEKYKDYFLQAAQLVPGNTLRNLRSCTIHFVDEYRSLYHLEHFSLIFAHPRLEKLTISCANIDSIDRFHPLVQEASPNTTPLTTLSLVECDFNLEGLYHLLSLPRNLRSLTMTEATHYVSYTQDRRYNGLQAPDCLHPIHDFQPNLFYLKICRLRCESRALFCLPQLDLTPFTKLSAVEYSHVYNTRLHPSPQEIPDLCALVHRSGPALNTGGPNTTTLIYSDIPYRCWERGLGFFICAFKDKALHGIGNLKTLRLVLIDEEPQANDFYGSEIQRAMRKHRAERLKRVRGLLLKLGTLGKHESVGIRVIVHWIRPASGTIPPYLMGEAKPKVVKEYDSADIPPLPKPRAMPQQPPEGPVCSGVNGYSSLEETEA